MPSYRRFRKLEIRVQLLTKMKKVFKYSMENISKVQKKLPKFAEGIFFNLNRKTGGWTSTRKLSFIFSFILMISAEREMFLIYSIDWRYSREASVELFSQAKWPSISPSLTECFMQFFFLFNGRRSFSILRHFEQKLRREQSSYQLRRILLKTSICTQTFLT